MSRHTVLVVEDEMMVAMMLQDMLEDAGYAVLHAGSLSKALKLAEENESAIDVAVLDVNLGGQRSYALADWLADRNIEFIFTTGHGRSEVRDLYPNRQIVVKPYIDRDIIAALAAAVDVVGRK